MFCWMVSSVAWSLPCLDHFPWSWLQWVSSSRSSTCARRCWSGYDLGEGLVKLVGVEAVIARVLFRPQIAECHWNLHSQIRCQHGLRRPSNGATRRCWEPRSGLYKVLVVSVR